MLKTFRGYHYFIKKHQRHKEAFGIHPVRAILVKHPLVSGPAKRTGLFWFTISPLFTDPVDGTVLARYLKQPELVLDSIWALPDRHMRALADLENSSAQSTELQAQ